MKISNVEKIHFSNMEHKQRSKLDHHSIRSTKPPFLFRLIDWSQLHSFETIFSIRADFGNSSIFFPTKKSDFGKKILSIETDCGVCAIKVILTFWKSGFPMCAHVIICILNGNVNSNQRFLNESKFNRFALQSVKNRFFPPF